MKIVRRVRMIGETDSVAAQSPSVTTMDQRDEIALAAHQDIQVRKRESE